MGGQGLQRVYRPPIWYNKNKKGGEKAVTNTMPTSLEVTKAAIDDFKKIQKYMILAREEQAPRTYAELKVILQVYGVDLTDIDYIQE